MPIGLVSDDEFELELNTVKGKIVDRPNEHGRNKGDLNIGEDIKKLIIEEVIEGGANRKELAKTLEVSQSTISAALVGASSTASYHDKKPVLSAHINGIKDRISRKASRVLRSSLDELTPDRVRTAKTKDIAIIARQMASIVKDMEPEEKETNVNNGVQFIMMAPMIRTEKHYEAIDVQALDGLD